MRVVTARTDPAACTEERARTGVSVPLCAKFLKSHGAYSNCCSFSCGEIFHCVRDRRAEARGQRDCCAWRFFERAHYYGAEGLARGGEARSRRPSCEEVGDPFDE